MNIDASTAKTLREATVLINQCTDAERAEVVQMIYRLGFINGGIAQTEQSLAKMKEAA